MILRVAGGTVVLLATLLPGCPERGFHDVQRWRIEDERLERSRARWESAGPADYAYEFERGCFCDPASTARVELQIVDGGLESGRYVESFRSGTGQEVAAGTALPEEELARFGTIDDVFGELDEILSAGPGRFEASYDPAYGFPSAVLVHFCSPEPCPDDGLTLELTDFVATGPFAATIARHLNRE